MTISKDLIAVSLPLLLAFASNCTKSPGSRAETRKGPSPVSAGEPASSPAPASHFPAAANEATSAPPPSTASSAPALSASPLLAAGAASAAQPNENVRTYFGKLLEVYEKERKISLEQLELLEGDEADRAAQEAGLVGPGEPADNDSFVRDQPGGRLILPVAASVEVLMLPHGRKSPHQSAAVPLPSTFDALVGHFEGSDWISQSVQASPYRVFVREVKGIKIEEVYFP